MPTSRYLAQLIGPVALVAGLGLFVNRDGYLGMARELLRSPALIYLSGMLAMTAGIAIVLAHNVWVAGWPIIVTVLGWLGVIGGAARMILPQQTRRIGEAMLAKPAAVNLGAAAWVAIGLVLCIFGYLR